MTIYPKNFFENSDVKITLGSCFVIMPFGEPYDELYHEVLKECLEDNNFSVIRADELYGTRPIMEDILKSIESAEIILADLTDKNPNVFYELGIAHTRKDNDNVIIITQNIADVPFDLRPFRVIVYKSTIAGIKSLKKQLSETLREFRIKPLTWSNYTWKPKSPIWYINNDQTLIGEIFKPGETPIIFNTSPFQKPNLQISFTATSSGPEINLMFYADGKNRFSGYHLWFWGGGVKLRRLGGEVELETALKRQKNIRHDITINYDEGKITVIIDKKEALNFLDDQPLHGKRGMEFIGFNIWSATKGNVSFYDLSIN